MRDILIGTWQFFNPVFQTTAIRQRLKFIDDHFAVLSSATALFISLVLWANI